MMIDLLHKDEYERLRERMYKEPRNDITASREEKRISADYRDSSFRAILITLLAAAIIILIALFVLISQPVLAAQQPGYDISVSINRADGRAYDETTLLASDDVIDNSLILSATGVPSSENGEDPVTFKWYKDDILLKDETKDRLVLKPDSDNNGTYLCTAIKDGTSVSSSEPVRIFCFDTMPPTVDIRLFRAVFNDQGDYIYKSVSEDENEACTHFMISVDCDDLNPADFPLALTKDTEEMPEPSSGLFTDRRKFLIAENGDYRIYARDLAGNIYRSDVLKITGIDTLPPVINSLLIEPETDKKGSPVFYNTQAYDDEAEESRLRMAPYMSVTVDAGSEKNADGFKYRLCLLNEDGTQINLSSKSLDGYQASPVFDHLSDDGSYQLTVKNELGAVSCVNFCINKDFYYASGDDGSSYTARLLIKPLSWTKKNVSFGISFQDSNYLDGSKPISIDNGDTFLALHDKECVFNSRENKEQEMIIKDSDGILHRSGKFTIENIDNAPPVLNVNTSDHDLSFNIGAKDSQSGLNRLCYTYTDTEGRTSEQIPVSVFIKTEDNDNSSCEISMPYTHPGTYTFYLYDTAGNMASSEAITVSSISIKDPENMADACKDEDTMPDENDIDKGALKPGTRITVITESQEDVPKSSQAYQKDVLDLGVQDNASPKKIRLKTVLYVSLWISVLFIIYISLIQRKKGFTLRKKKAVTEDTITAEEASFLESVTYKKNLDNTQPVKDDIRENDEATENLKDIDWF